MVHMYFISPLLPECGHNVCCWFFTDSSNHWFSWFWPSFFFSFLNFLYMWFKITVISLINMLKALTLQWVLLHGSTPVSWTHFCEHCWCNRCSVGWSLHFQHLCVQLKLRFDILEYCIFLIRRLGNINLQAYLYVCHVFMGEINPPCSDLW